MKNFFGGLALFVSLSLSPVFVSRVDAGVLYIGTDDLPILGDGDFQDAFLRLSGTVNVFSDGTGSWQNMPIPNQDYTPYWDRISLDGSQRNVGYLITGTGGFIGNAASPNWSPITTSFWGVGNGADSSILFSSVGSQNATLVLEMSSWANFTSVYWYDQTTPGLLNIIATGPMGAGTSITFTPSAVFGLAFSNLSGTFRSGTQGEQFAVFTNNGLEGDIGAVPEPSTYAMLSLGLIGLGLIRRRK